MMRGSLRVARFSALLCLCLAISALENILQGFVVFPIAGIKLGLSNLVILFALSKKERSTPWILMGARSVFTALLFGNPTTLFFSLSGGVLSVLAMQGTLPLLKHKFSFFSISITGSLAFQTGQICAALILYGTPILYYSPILLFCGTLTGAVLGLLQNILYVRLKPIEKSGE